MEQAEKTKQDVLFMRHAILLAQQAEANNEVPVGALLVLDGEIIGEGFNSSIGSNDCTSHAEIIALRNACQKVKNYRLPNTVLYVTLEPCLMCVGAMIHARIGNLVFGAYDTKAGMCGSVLNALEVPELNHKVVCRGGVLAEECGELLTNFFRERR